MANVPSTSKRTSNDGDEVKSKMIRLVDEVDGSSTTGSARVRNVTDLPPEIIVEVMSYLSAYDKLRCARVCKSWNQISKAGVLWKKLNLSKVSLRLAYASRIIRTYGSEHTRSISLEGWFTPSQFHTNYPTFSNGLIKVIAERCLNLEELCLVNMMWGGTDKEWDKLKSGLSTGRGGKLKTIPPPPVKKLLLLDNRLKFQKVNIFTNLLQSTLQEVTIQAWNTSYMHNLAMPANVNTLRLIFSFPLDTNSSGFYNLPLKLIRSLNNTATLCVSFRDFDAVSMRDSIDNINSKVHKNLQMCGGCKWCEEISKNLNQPVQPYIMWGQGLGF